MKKLLFLLFLELAGGKTEATVNSNLSIDTFYYDKYFPVSNEFSKKFFKWDEHYSIIDLDSVLNTFELKRIKPGKKIMDWKCVKEIAFDSSYQELNAICKVENLNCIGYFFTIYEPDDGFNFTSLILVREKDCQEIEISMRFPNENGFAISISWLTDLNHDGYADIIRRNIDVDVDIPEGITEIHYYAQIWEDGNYSKSIEVTNDPKYFKICNKLLRMYPTDICKYHDVR